MVCRGIRGFNGTRCSMGRGKLGMIVYLHISRCTGTTRFSVTGPMMTSSPIEPTYTSITTTSAIPSEKIDEPVPVNEPCRPTSRRRRRRRRVSEGGAEGRSAQLDYRSRLCLRRDVNSLVRLVGIAHPRPRPLPRRGLVKEYSFHPRESCVEA